MTLKWFNLTPVLSGDTECSTFDVKPYARKRHSAGNDFFDVHELKPYPHLNRIALKGHSYANSEMILGLDIFHVIRPLEYFEMDQQNTAIANPLRLGWVSSGPLLSMSGLFCTCFKALSHIECDFNLAYQFRSWYEVESFGAH